MLTGMQPFGVVLRKTCRAAFQMVCAAGLCAASLAQAAGLSVSDSRIIIDKGKNSSAIVFRNTSGHQFLSKAWIEDSKGVPSEDVMVAPPFAYSPSGKHIRFQVTAINPDVLPTDRESLLYFRMHSVPAGNDSQNKLTIAYDVKLKVFYRPLGLSGSMEEAIEDLRWTLKDGVLTAQNNSNFNVSLLTWGIEKDYTQVDDCVIAPGSSQSFKVNKKYPSKVTVRWAAMDDYGTALRFSDTLDNE